MTGTPYRYRRSARRVDGVMVVAAVWAGVGLLVWIIDMVWWIAAILLATTAPALWDIWTARAAGLDLDDDRIAWFSGRLTGDVARDEIATIRLDTRLDLSVRVTVVLRTGKKIRLPHDSLPPHKRLEAELRARNFACERHHFALF